MAALKGYKLNQARRFVDSSDNRPCLTLPCLDQVGTEKLLEFKGEDKQFPASAWVAAPVPAGSLVLIHGQVTLNQILNYFGAYTI